MSRPKKILAQLDENGLPASQSLYVVGYGRGTTKSEMEALFSRLVPVIAISEKTIGERSFMFVKTSNVRDAMMARRSLYGSVVNGSHMKINFSRY
jgi:RNA recognition motif-containing protein